MNAIVRVACSRPPCLPIVRFLSAQISGTCLASPLLVVFCMRSKIRQSEFTHRRGRSGRQHVFRFAIHFHSLEIRPHMKIIVATISLLASGLLENAQTRKVVRQDGKKQKRGGGWTGLCGLVCKESLRVSVPQLCPMTKNWKSLFMNSQIVNATVRLLLSTFDQESIVSLDRKSRLDLFSGCRRQMPGNIAKLNREVALKQLQTARFEHVVAFFGHLRDCFFQHSIKKTWFQSNEQTGKHVASVDGEGGCKEPHSCPYRNSISGT